MEAIRLHSVIHLLTMVLITNTKIGSSRNRVLKSQTNQCLIFKLSLPKTSKAMALLPRALKQTLQIINVKIIAAKEATVSVHFKHKNHRTLINLKIITIRDQYKCRITLIISNQNFKILTLIMYNPKSHNLKPHSHNKNSRQLLRLRFRIKVRSKY